MSVQILQIGHFFQNIYMNTNQMKNYSFFTFTIIAILAMLATSQNYQDPQAEYNFTYIENWPYNYSRLQLCQIPAPDGSHCEKCMYNLTRMDQFYGGKLSQYGYCAVDFPNENCYAIDHLYNCILCHDGYTLNMKPNDLSFCIPKTVGCQNYDNIRKICLTCQPGWTMNTTLNGASNQIQNSCYFIKDSNCLNYDANNVCLGCVTSYSLSNNKCVFWLENCGVMNSNVCAQCNTNYELDASGKCVEIPKIVNCHSQVDYTCSACVSGYSLVNNQCFYVIANCAQVKGMVCEKCDTGFSVTVEGQCAAIPRIPNCNNQVEFACQSCAAGYTLSNNQCHYMIDNCASVIGKVCAQCNTNYEITQDGKCAPIPQIINCASQIDYTCQACIQGYTLSSNECIYVIENCAQVDGIICTKCNSEFYINGEGKCDLIPQVPNCLSQQDFTCYQCATGFTLINNQCLYIIDNCAQVNGMICSKCNSGFSITQDGKCSAIPKIPNCASQVESTCQSCLAGFILSENLCQVSISNCLEYTGATCNKCEVGFILTGFNTCISASRIPNCAIHIGPICNRCDMGYNLINNRCVSSIENCLKVSGTTCQQCKEGFIVGPNGECILDPFAGLDPNCRLYDLATFNKCLTCSGGFFLNAQGKCEQVDPLCRSFNGKNGFCLSCYIGYSLDITRGKCIKKSILTSEAELDYCHQYDYVNNVCVKCAEGCYFDANGKCHKYSDVNCKKPSADLKACDECYKGYVFDATQEKCIVGNFNCATWSNGRCATCPKGYYLDETSNCIMLDQFCKILNPMNKVCMICYPGYVLDTDKKCKQLKLASPTVLKYNINCAKYMDGECTDCYFGYYVKRDTVGSYCEKANDLCKSYDKLNGQCTSCYLGYYLSTQGECLRYF